MTEKSQRALEENHRRWYHPLECGHEEATSAVGNDGERKRGAGQRSLLILASCLFLLLFAVPCFATRTIIYADSSSGSLWTEDGGGTVSVDTTSAATSSYFDGALAAYRTYLSFWTGSLPAGETVSSCSLYVRAQVIYASAAHAIVQCKNCVSPQLIGTDWTLSGTVTLAGIIASTANALYSNACNITSTYFDAEGWTDFRIKTSELPPDELGADFYGRRAVNQINWPYLAVITTPAAAGRIKYNPASVNVNDTTIRTGGAEVRIR